MTLSSKDRQDLSTTVMDIAREEDNGYLPITSEALLVKLWDAYQRLERQDQAVRAYLESLRPAVDVAESGTLIGEPKLLRCIIADLERAVEGNYPIPQHEVKRIAASLKED